VFTRFDKCTEYGKQTRILWEIGVSKRFNIPQAATYSRMSDARNDNRSGRKAILTEYEETFFVDAVEVFRQWQQPVFTSSIRQVVKAYMLELGENSLAKTTFRGWLSNFLARWATESKVSQAVKLEIIRLNSCIQHVANQSRPSTL
jgi:hypothetical protein